MRRAAALRLLGGLVTASLAGCETLECTIPMPPLKSSRSVATRFGAQIYPEDDVERAMGMLAQCGASLVRIGIDGNFDFADAVFAASARHSIRVVLLTQFLRQPVDVAAYASAHAALQQRYAKYEPVWEIWNEPNLVQFWGAQPSVIDYSRLAIETGKALRAAGARDVWSGGISGIDFEWIAKLKSLGVFDVLNGCAVHSYEDPCLAYSHYGMLLSLVPAGVEIHTTETCISSPTDQADFLRQMWDIHRVIGLPTMIWCEFRDGTAGKTGSNAFPYGLVHHNYTPKPSYQTAQVLVARSTA